MLLQLDVGDGVLVVLLELDREQLQIAHACVAVVANRLVDSGEHSLLDCICAQRRRERGERAKREGEGEGGGEREGALAYVDRSKTAWA